jgi:8-oxo-dGTP diphosphatase
MTSREAEALTGSQTRQRIAAYGVARGASDRVLLVRAASSGRWFLPGGGVLHGEHPEHALAREFYEETGLTIRAASLRAVLSDVTELMTTPVILHSIRLVYDVEVEAGDLRAETEGSSDRVCWFTAEQARSLPLQPFVSEVLSPVARAESNAK